MRVFLSQLLIYGVGFFNKLVVTDEISAYEVIYIFSHFN